MDCKNQYRCCRFRISAISVVIIRDDSGNFVDASVVFSHWAYSSSEALYHVWLLLFGGNKKTLTMKISAAL